ncbi:MAG: DUF1275 domain-containing protein [Moraxellaceae bacterium]|nr:MAG: DUF1275 domain-containing protein [Moraxellaceae bacterium]
MPLQTLPLWIQLSAFLLALNAGMINILAIFNLAHQTISHMTGNLSYIVVDIIQHDWQRVWFLLAVVFFFTLGAFYSGFIIRDSKLRFGRRYGTVLSLEAFFLLMTWLFISQHPHYALLWAAAACGMQNGMASTYNGTIIRTTHLSGVLTDLGLALGHSVRGLYVDTKRVILHLLILLGFFTGGILGSLAFYFSASNSFLAPMLLTTGLSVLYWCFYINSAKSHNP